VPNPANIQPWQRHLQRFRSLIIFALFWTRLSHLLTIHLARVFEAIEQDIAKRQNP
jgi:hypothetical protein